MNRPTPPWFQRLDFVFVTGNPFKVLEAERILGRAILSQALSLREIQSMDLSEVLAVKGEDAWSAIGEALVVEDSGLYVSGLGGFPGPFVKLMLDAAGPVALATAALAVSDGYAVARCGLLLKTGPHEQWAAFGEVAGHLVVPPRGNAGFGWDSVFVPVGEELTVGEMSPEEKDAVSHRARAWRALMGNLA